MLIVVKAASKGMGFASCHHGSSTSKDKELNQCEKAGFDCNLELTPRFIALHH